MKIPTKANRSPLTLDMYDVINYDTMSQRWSVRGLSFSANKSPVAGDYICYISKDDIYHIPKDVFDKTYAVSADLPTKLTPESINSVIVSEERFNPEMVPHMTVCHLKLKNGFVVSGQSCPVDPDNYDADIGWEIARKNAVDKIWELEGYLLRERLSA